MFEFSFCCEVFRRKGVGLKNCKSKSFGLKIAKTNWTYVNIAVKIVCIEKEEIYLKTFHQKKKLNLNILCGRLEALCVVAQKCFD